MKNIIIVDAHSTGVNFIDDAIKRGYNPVVLRNKNLDEADASYVASDKKVRERFEDRAEFYDDIPTYEEMLEIARQIDPVIILTGSERNVETALHLTKDMGFPSNPEENLPYFKNKDLMQEACKNYGIRHVRSKRVNSAEEAVDFYRSENLFGCVVKPSRGGGSVGVHLCDSEEEMINAFNQEFGKLNVYGEETGVVIQERIRGTEYVVNIISYNGVHSLNSIAKYKKIRSKDGDILYDQQISSQEKNDQERELVEYAFKVADAVGFKYGAIHGEYMIDEKGPVLIEINCRVMGGGLPSDFLDYTIGHHETDPVIDMFLNPEKYYENRVTYDNYKIKRTGAIKSLISPRKMTTVSMPVLSIIKHFKSYFGDTFAQGDKKDLPKTTDIATSPGDIFLGHEDEALLMKELNFLSDVNLKYEDLCYEDEKDYKGGKTLREKVDDFYALADKLSEGESFVVPDEILQSIPYGEEGVKILCWPLEIKTKDVDGKLVCEK